MVIVNSVEERVNLLQDNLQTLRILAGWSADDLAHMLDVSRQTIVKLEHKNGARMTKMQYLAIRSLFDAEIQSSNNNILAKAIEGLVDDKEKLSEETREKIRHIVKEKTKSVGRRVGSSTAGAVAMAAVSGILGATIIGVAVPFALDFLKSKDNS